MRKLATIRQIADILPIEGADAIVLVKVDDWQCVAKKEEFSVGDLCVYYEIDSFLPLRPEYEHIRSRAYKKMGEQEGLRIKTIKLRGQISQGLALPISEALKAEWSHTFLNFEDARNLRVGDDVSEILGVQKYESPIPTQLAGKVSGNFPGFIKKTDQERCQNIGCEIFVDNFDSKYEVTMKMDGTSFTGYFNKGITGVCGRNWELKIDENEANSLVRMFVDSGLQEALGKIGRNLAVQGELMGPGIQKNREGFASHKLFIFDIYDIDVGNYIPPEERRAILEVLYAHGMNKEMVQHVPIIAYTANLYDTLGIRDVNSLLVFADGKSLVHPIREGLVFKRIDGKFSFKAISNRYLLKEED